MFTLTIWVDSLWHLRRFFVEGKKHVRNKKNQLTIKLVSRNQEVIPEEGDKHEGLSLLDHKFDSNV
eukprot:snap_masked-scaffold124_size330879-processed-gene-1.7 protein:Tk01486 transcript:snap_masked-scaffold124_size330879-processed-gene-1.7-mRNA-1 annotation:"---NA---"